MKERTIAGLRCSEILELLSEYLDGELEAATVENIDSHLLGCPNCERFGKDFGSMVLSLRQSTNATESIDLKLVARLLTEIDGLNADS